MSEKKLKRLAMEAKVLTALALRRAGPLEQIHEDNRISQAEMKAINKKAVDTLFLLLALKERKPDEYWNLVALLSRMVSDWDDPEPITFSAKLKDLAPFLGRL